MLFPVLLIFVVAALLLLICVGCTWLEQRQQSTKRGRWLSSHHDTGWSDTTHVLETTEHNHGILDWIGGDGDADAAGGCDGGGD